MFGLVDDEKQIRATLRFINKHSYSTKTAPPSLAKICWSFDDLPKSFAGFGLDFA